MRLRAGLVCLVTACFSENSSSGGNGSNSADTTATEGPTSNGSAGTTAATMTSGVSSATDSATTVPDTSATDGTATDGGCPEGTVMPPTPSEDWTGPFVLLPPNAETCGSGLDDGMPLIVNSMPRGPSACGCACSPTCRVFAYDPATACNDVVALHDVADGGCIDLEGNFAIRNGNTEGVTDCVAPVPVAPPVYFPVQHRVCTDRGDACLPIPGGAIGPCLRKDGDQQCALDLPVRLLTVNDVTVTCAACLSCLGPLAAACAAGALTLHPDGSCQEAGVVIDPNMCSDPSAGLSARLDFDLNCDATTVESSTPVAPVTYCCAEPPA